MPGLLSYVEPRRSVGAGGSGRFGRTSGTSPRFSFQRLRSPCFPPLFLSVISFLEKLSKPLIPLAIARFVLNRLPVFLGKSPCFPLKKDGTATVRNWHQKLLIFRCRALSMTR